MARAIMSKMIDTFRSLRPGQGFCVSNFLPSREFRFSQCVLSPGNVHYSGNHSNFSTLTSQTVGFGPCTSLLQIAGNVQISTTRTNVRCHFPRPSEYKRIKRHGWKTRMSTQAGRRIIMRKILQGRHVLTH